MKPRKNFLIVLGVLSLAVSSLIAQDDAKTQELQQRFQQGYDLQQQGKLTEARAVYDGILAENAQARRSLLEAGRISLQLGEFAKAEDYLDKLHTLEPTFPAALEMYIQAAQALGQDVKIDRLRTEFQALHDAGKTEPLYVRERIKQPNGTTVIMTEFFDYTQEPNTLWMGEQFDANGNLLHRVLLNYDPVSTKDVRGKDPRLATAEVFLLLEDVMKDGRPTALNVYNQYFAKPDYRKTRASMIAIMTNPPKPIYSAPVPAGT